MASFESTIITYRKYDYGRYFMIPNPNFGIEGLVSQEGL